MIYRSRIIGVLIDSITQIGRFDGSKGFTYISPNAIIVLDTGRVNLVDVSATTSETQAILTFSSAAKPQEVASILPHDVETCFVADGMCTDIMSYNRGDILRLLLQLLEAYPRLLYWTSSKVITPQQEIHHAATG